MFEKQHGIVLKIDFICPETARIDPKTVWICPKNSMGLSKNCLDLSKKNCLDFPKQPGFVMKEAGFILSSLEKKTFDDADDLNGTTYMTVLTVSCKTKLSKFTFP